MTSGDTYSINLRLKVSKDDVGLPSQFLLSTLSDISVFNIVGIEKSQSTGNEIAEYVVTLIEK